MNPWAYGIIYGDQRQHRTAVVDKGAAELLIKRLHGVLVPLVPMWEAPQCESGCGSDAGAKQSS